MLPIERHFFSDSKSLTTVLHNGVSDLHEGMREPKSPKDLGAECLQTLWQLLKQQYLQSSQETYNAD